MDNEDEDGRVNEFEFDGVIGLSGGVSLPSNCSIGGEGEMILSCAGSAAATADIAGATGTDDDGGRSGLTFGLSALCSRVGEAAALSHLRRCISNGDIGGCPGELSRGGRLNFASEGLRIDPSILNEG